MNTVTFQCLAHMCRQFSQQKVVFARHLHFWSALPGISLRHSSWSPLRHRVYFYLCRLAGWPAVHLHFCTWVCNYWICDLCFLNIVTWNKARRKKSKSVRKWSLCSLQYCWVWYSEENKAISFGSLKESNFINPKRWILNFWITQNVAN